MPEYFEAYCFKCDLHVRKILQQRQSISLASFLQCPHLYLSRFPILICNKSAAEAWMCLVPFSWLSLPQVFSVQAQTEMVEEWWSEILHCHLYFSQFFFSHISPLYFYTFFIKV